MENIQKRLYKYYEQYTISIETKTVAETMLEISRPQKKNKQVILLLY